MPVVTRHIVQTFRRNSARELVGDQPFVARTPEEAIRRVERLSDKVVGAVAIRWTGDMRTGEEGSVEVLKRSGVLPIAVLEQIYGMATPY